MPRSMAGRSKAEGGEWFDGTGTASPLNPGLFGTDYAGGGMRRAGQTSTKMPQPKPAKEMDLWKDNLVLDSSHTRCILPQHHEGGSDTLFYRSVVCFFTTWVFD
jgi:hypothetical protein